MKKSLFVLIALFAFSIFPAVSQDIQSRQLYSGGIYGQTFELTELTDGNECLLLLDMYDNKTKLTKNYDPDLPLQFRIFSDFFSNASEYSRIVKACKQFFDVSMDLVYLADMKDICDIAPCCDLNEYKIKVSDSGKKYIYIEYDCDDLELLFKIAGLYNAKGRAYVMEKYSE